MIFVRRRWNTDQSLLRRMLDAIMREPNNSLQEVGSEQEGDKTVVGEAGWVKGGFFQTKTKAGLKAEPNERSRG